MEFRVTINLPDAAMRTGDDVADALHELSKRLFVSRRDGATPPCGKVKNARGKVIGDFQFREG